MCIVAWFGFSHVFGQASSTNDTTTVNFMDNGIINRLNFGFVAYSNKRVCVVDGYWHHSYHIKLPNYRNFSHSLAAAQNHNFTGCNSNCRDLVPVVSAILGLGERFRSSIATWHSKVIALIVDLRARAPGSRSSRGLIDGIGSFYRYAFGVATLSDLEEMKQHIQQIQLAAETAASDSIHVKDSMSTFTILQNERLDTLRTMINTNQITIRQLYTTVQDESTNLVSMERVLHKLVNMIGRFTQVHDAMESLELGIEALVLGRITPNIIPVTEVRRMLRHVDGALRPHAQLCSTSVTEFYNAHTYELARMNADVVIRVHIPFSKTNLVDVYTTITTDMPVSSLEPMVSVLPTLPTTFLIDQVTHTVGFPLTNSFTTLMSRTDADFSSSPTQECAQALLFGSASEVARLCAISLVRRSASPLFRNVGQSVYVVNSIPTAAIVCGNSSRILTDCNPCLLTLKCKCKLVTLGPMSKVMAENMNLCDNITDSDPESLLFPVNLAMVNAFYDEVNETSSSQLFAQPPDVPILNLTFFGDEMAHLSSKDEQLSYKLAKVSDNLRNSSVILGTPLEALMFNLFNSRPSFWQIDTYNWTTWFLFLIFFACLVNFAFFLKIRRQLTFISMSLFLHRKTVVAYSLKVTSDATEPSQSQYFFDSVTTALRELRHLDIAFAFTTLLTCITFIYLFRRTVLAQRRKSQLFLQIYHPLRTLEVCMQTLPSSTRDYSIQIPNAIRVRFVDLKLFGILLVNTNHWLITNTLTRKRVSLPRHFVIGPCLARAIRQAPLASSRVVMIHNFEYEFFADPAVPSPIVTSTNLQTV